jgi:hypothetical protein
MATSLNVLIIFMTLAVTTVTVSCSGAKFAASSGKSSGGTTEKPAEQPEDVAGGFGLTCSQSDNQADPLSIDYSCTFVTNIGQKFQETADQKVELKVQSGGKDVTFVNQDPTSSSSFKFTVLKSEITSVKIAAKVTNPLDGNKVKGEINKALSDVIDTTPPFAPSVTGTSTSTANTTPTWSWSSGGNGGNGTYRYRLNNSNLASGAVEISGTSFTPSAALSAGTHTLYVQERDAAGNWSASGSFAIQVVTPPAVPTLTTLTPSLNSLSLSWAPVTGVTYNLYWSNSAGVTTASSKISNVVSVYNHTPLSGGTTYYYKLAAVKSGVESALSNEVSAAPFSSPAPTITAITPNSGPTSGGTTVTISGSGFLPDTTVTIDNINVPVTEKSSTSLTVTTPAGMAAGAKNVVVTNPDTQRASSSFTYGSFQCSGSNEDCYAKAESDSVAIGTMIPGPETNSQLIYQFANGSNGFKIWKENNGSRILNASGRVSNGWQKKLIRDGTRGDSTAFLDDPSKIEGRACPDKVFNGSSGTCLYYSSILVSLKSLQEGKNTGGLIKGEDYLDEWTANRGTMFPCQSSTNTAPAWYVGNIKTCADLGMRLPVLYEFKEWKSGCTASCDVNHRPLEVVNESDSKGLPPSNVWTATASSWCTNGWDALYGKYFWQVFNDQGQLRTFSNPRSDSFANIRCVLPGH